MMQRRLILKTHSSQPRDCITNQPRGGAYTFVLLSFLHRASWSAWRECGETSAEEVNESKSLLEHRKKEEESIQWLQRCASKDCSRGANRMTSRSCAEKSEERRRRVMGKASLFIPLIAGTSAPDVSMSLEPGKAH